MVSPRLLQLQTESRKQKTISRKNKFKERYVVSNQTLFLRLEISALLLQRKFHFEFRKIQTPI